MRPGGFGDRHPHGRDGHDVSVIDNDPEALARLPEDWPGQFAQGHGLDIDVLIDAGIETADACVVATDGDNTKS